VSPETEKSTFGKGVFHGGMGGVRGVKENSTGPLSS